MDSFETCPETEFVDRESEMRRFCGLLDSPTKHIMLVWGDNGIGKTSLLARMIHECASRHLAKSEVVWTDTRPYNYMDIMRQLRDDLGVDAFNAFTDRINFYTKDHYELKIVVQGSVEVGKQASISNGANVENIGVQVNVNDLMSSAPRTDMAVPESERMARLTDQFVQDFRALQKDKLVVVFFDAVEKMSSETEKWLWSELLKAACDGRLANVKFVLCGVKKPEYGRAWREYVEEAQLQPLTREHILAYFEKRHVRHEHWETLATVLLMTTHGKVAEVATWVDAFLEQPGSKDGE
jgi:hypothetical protein